MPVGGAVAFRNAFYRGGCSCTRVRFEQRNDVIVARDKATRTYICQRHKYTPNQGKS